MEETEIEAFINRLQVASNSSSLDRLCELAVSSYRLDKKSRKMELKDQCQFFFKWWHKNQKKMKVYRSLDSIGKLCGNKNHATILHSIRSRKPSLDYEDNVASLKDFLES